MYRKTNAKAENINARLRREAETGQVRYWIDRDGQLEPALDLVEWAERLNDWSLKCVAENTFDAPLHGPVRLVTIFNGLDYEDVMRVGPPQLYSTAVFRAGHLELGEWWTATRAEALALHERVRLGLERGDPVIRARGLIEQENTN